LLLAAQMVRDLITRDINNPSVIVWSVGNEVPVERINCQRFMATLMDWARKLDDSRLVMYTSNRFAADTLRRKSDINALNAYFGWYIGKTKHLNFILDLVHSKSPNNPLMLTEFGAGAKFGLRGSQKKFSEDYQAQLIGQTIEILNSKPYVGGWFIWIYRDFRSALRQNKFQMGFNRKGIVDEHNRPKLVARIMPHIIDRERTDLHRYRYLAPILGQLLAYLEGFLMKLGMRIGYKIQRKMVAAYYSNVREVTD
jgi:hypothetical protein